MARIAVWNRQESGGSEQVREAAPGDTLEDGDGTEITVRKHNYDASGPPSINDDASDGYAVGSRWIDRTADNDYVCTDATVGAAVWRETTNPSTSLDPTAIHKATPNEIKNIALKGPVTAADLLLIEDAAAAWAKKSIPIGNLKLALKLDQFVQPDDNTNLDATTGRHGLLPKLGGGTTNFLRADGSWAAPASGDVNGPASSLDNAIARFDGVTGKVIQGSGPTINDAGDVDMGGRAINNVGNVDGVDVSAHASRHENGGADELDVTGLSGLLADDQNPVNHATDHEPGGSDAMAVDAVPATGSLRTLGAGAQQACAGNDARLSDSRTPTAHASSHENGGGDEIDVTGLSGALADPQTPTTHATTHQNGGSDAVKLDDLATPDDNTDLNATTGRHGLLPKLAGGVTTFLRADGAWASASHLPLTANFFRVNAGGDVAADSVKVNAGAGWVLVGSFVFPGTGVVTPTTFKVIGSRSGSGGGNSSVRLYDATNGAQVGLVTFSAAGRAIYADLALSNLPAGEALFELQGRSSGANDLFIHSMALS